MRNWLWLLGAGILILGAMLPVQAQSAKDVYGAADLAPISGSSATAGTATLYGAGAGGTEVMVLLPPAGVDPAATAHIHQGPWGGRFSTP